MVTKKIFSIYIRNLIFGVEDSLVSTVGLLSGIAVAQVPRGTIFLTGLVLIFVEAFSMATGSFLSEHSTEEYETRGGDNKGIERRSITASIVMFISYFASGFVPLTPYLVFETPVAFGVSIAASVFSLFVLGIVSAKLTKAKLMRSALEMSVLGGAAILVGILVGKFAKL